MYARSINSYLTWLHEDGHITEPLRIRLLPNPPKPVATFSDADIRQLVMFRPARPTHLRTWTLALTLLDTGLRIAEALGLERANVDLDNLVLRVVGKGTKERLVPISIECRKHLYRLTTKQSGRYVFSTHRGGRLRYRNVYRDIKALCRAAGVAGPRVHPHNFRHCFAVGYIRNGGDIYRLSRILGHSTISTTQLYLRSMGIEHLQEGHEGFSPLSGKVQRCPEHDQSMRPCRTVASRIWWRSLGADPSRREGLTGVDGDTKSEVLVPGSGISRLEKRRTTASNHVAARLRIQYRRHRPQDPQSSDNRERWF